MTTGRLLAIGIAAYAVALAFQAPATLVDAGLQNATGGRLRLSQATGSFWAGSGWVEIRDAASTNAIARGVEWRVLPETLWRARFIAEIRLEGAARPFTVSSSPAETAIRQVDIELPATLLAQAEPRLKPLRLSGALRVRAPDLAVGRDGMRGKLSVQWLQAGSAVSPVSPLGSYELDLAGEGKNIQATLSTLDGPVRFDGSGTWAVSGKPRIVATIDVPPDLREQLTPLLRLISRQRDEGTFEVRLE